MPTIGEYPRQASRHRQQLLSTGESRSSCQLPTSPTINGDHALACSKGHGGQMDVWKRVRHDGARNILVHLGKAAGLREGADTDVEVPYLFTRYRPSDIRVRIRPGGQNMHFEGIGANGFELPGAASRTWPTT
jgi:hypothetical protein